MKRPDPDLMIAIGTAKKKAPIGADAEGDDAPADRGDEYAKGGRALLRAIRSNDPEAIGLAFLRLHEVCNGGAAGDEPDEDDA